MTKTRFDAAVAREVARELLPALKPACEKIEIAGSMRRGSPAVGDLEIVYIPRAAETAEDLFAKTTRPAPDLIFDRWIAEGRIERRLSKTGSPAWGEKNKLATHCQTGLPIDLFATTAEAWFNYLVCRTGPAELNTLIASRAKEKGWTWNPYGAGFSRGGPLAGASESVAVKSEAEVFEFVGLKYCPPEQRNRFKPASSAESCPDCRYCREERAAIEEYLAGLPRFIAEERAASERCPPHRET